MDRGALEPYKSTSVVTRISSGRVTLLDHRANERLILRLHLPSQGFGRPVRKDVRIATIDDYLNV